MPTIKHYTYLKGILSPQGNFEYMKGGLFMTTENMRNFFKIISYT
jgi:hypothetical protein